MMSSTGLGSSFKTRIRTFTRRKSSSTVPSAFSPFSSFIGRKESNSNGGWQHHHGSDPGDADIDTNPDVAAGDARPCQSAPPDIAATVAVRLGQQHPPLSVSVPATAPSPVTPPSSSGSDISTSSNDPFDQSPDDRDDSEDCAQAKQSPFPGNHSHSQAGAVILPEKPDSSSTPSLSSSRSSFLDAAAPQSDPFAATTNGIDSSRRLVGSLNTTTASDPFELSLHPDTSHEPALGLDPTLPSLPPTTRDGRPIPSSAMPPTTAAGASSLDTSPQAALLRALVQICQPNAVANPAPADTGAPVATRKVWVKRRGASATLVAITVDAIVDDVRDMILRKYSNSLGRYFDSPDLNLHIIPRDKKQARPLGPEEILTRTLDLYYPGGQNVEEALIIDVPVQRTPRPSPRAPASQHSISYLPVDVGRPPEGGEGYFPPVAPASSSLAPPAGVEQPSLSAPAVPSGQPPAMPSPGAGHPRPTRERTDRPRTVRTHTSSPTVQGGTIPTTKPALLEPDSTSATPPHPPSSDPSDPTPTTQVSSTPARSTSPRPTKKIKSPVDPAVDRPKVPVPPISVLIVEDNPINLRLLQLFATKLKVRSQSCTNGRDAVNKWRGGGFHLVLMDIQLPVMNGLDATREIRRLERVNEIGVNVGGAPDEEGETKEEDILENRDMFKSPVIIVALTASSLQSDRHEALAAGCNDFLTKPVSLKWLETKVREWGCMQALIDFDGWRQWKDFEEADVKNKSVKKTTATKSKGKKSHQTETAVAS